MEVKMKVCPNCGTCYREDVTPICPNCKAVPPPDGVRSTIPKTEPADYSNSGKRTEAADMLNDINPVVGWLVCIEGPMRGIDFKIYGGYNYIGREDGEIVIQGDNQISRAKHAVISYYAKRDTYFVGPAEGRNIIELNDEPVFNATEMKSYDVITVGSTKLMLIGLCGKRFNWAEGVKHE